MFDVSIYTDSTAAESLDGVVGFNFQAASDGFTPTDQRAVQQHLMHRVVTGWAVENDPLAHPPSCQYRPVGDRLYLTRGRSTGQTTNGRPGNQLTQSLATGNVDDFTPYRPAQLFGARRWSLEKAPGKSLDAWATPLEIDPEFEAAALKDSLLSDAWARQVFPLFLTMIEQAAAEPAKKLVVVHDDLAHTMKWIALGTLFLDPTRAGAVRFAALVKNPLAVDADIVGTSPVFGPPPPTAADTVCNVFDLLARQATPVEISPSAAEQAAWFTEMDAEDALAAVDLARAWEPALGAVDATRLARIVHLGGSADPAGDADIALRAVTSMVRAGQDDEVAMYADELLATILQSPPSTEGSARAATQAAWVARQAGIDALAADLTSATLRTAAGDPELIAAWAHETAELCVQEVARAVDAAHQRQYEQSLVDTINRAPAEALPDLLVIAKAFDLRVPPSRIGEGLMRFEEWWLRHPELSDGRIHRAYRRETTGGVAGRLVRLLDGGDETAMADLRNRQWHWLSDEIRSPVDGWIAAADLAALAPADRARRLADRMRSAGIPLNAWPLVLEGISWPADCRLVAQWIGITEEVPEPMNRWLASEIDRTLILPDGEAVAARPVLVALLRNGVRVDGRHLDRVLDDMRMLASCSAAATRAIRDPDNRALEDFAARLGRYRPFFLDEIGALLVGAYDERSLRKLIRTVGESVTPAMVHELRRRFDRDDPVSALGDALYLNRHGLIGQTDGARAFLTELADSRERRAQVDDMKRDLQEEWAHEWDEFLSENKKGRLTRNLVRGGKRLFGKENQFDG